jgi:hypothetical protein
MTARSATWLRTHWFAVLAPPLVLMEWLVLRNFGAEMGAFSEAVVLFDLCVFVPMLYLLCYGRSLPLKSLLLRTLGLVCLGVYLAGHIVPDEAQHVLAQIEPVRLVGLGVLMLVELRLFLLAMRVVWRPGATAADVQAASGAPPWIARIMLIEARFWKAVWSFIRRR